MNKLKPIKPLLSSVPAVHEIQKISEVQDLIDMHGNFLVTQAIRTTQSDFRKLLLSSSSSKNIKIKHLEFISQLRINLSFMTNDSLQRVFNLTGTVLHTNFGRALLPKQAINSINQVASEASNLEYDILNNKRGDRDSHIDERLCRLIGAEACTIVNNNAAAVVLVLNSLAKRKEVLISRGELIEIGGSFRLPEIMKSAGCKILEVGTTNRTHIEDFEDALGKKSAMIFKAHKSNFNVEGYTSEVDEKDIVKLSKKNNIPFMVDLGSGSLIDLRSLGITKVQSPKDTIARGVDLITFSGDKLLGGPQCGIIAGRKDLITKIKKNPLKRALRCDKMTIAAFSTLLKLYENPERAKLEIPTLRLLNRKEKEIYEVAKKLFPLIKLKVSNIAEVKIIKCKSQIGSGSLPVELLPSYGIKISALNIKRNSNKFLQNMSKKFRELPIPIIGRLSKDSLIFDCRCLESETLIIKQLEKLNSEYFLNI
jgi:L-seryl-tRNA(Ser) seleniumtransferase